MDWILSVVTGYVRHCRHPWNGGNPQKAKFYPLPQPPWPPQWPRWFLVPQHIFRKNINCSLPCLSLCLDSLVMNDKAFKYGRLLPVCFNCQVLMFCAEYIVVIALILHIGHCLIQHYLRHGKNISSCGACMHTRAYTCRHTSVIQWCETIVLSVWKLQNLFMLFCKGRLRGL